MVFATPFHAPVSFRSTPTLRPVTIDSSIGNSASSGIFTTHGAEHRADTFCSEPLHCGPTQESETAGLLGTNQLEFPRHLTTSIASAFVAPFATLRPHRICQSVFLVRALGLCLRASGRPPFGAEGYCRARSPGTARGVAGLLLRKLSSAAMPGGC